MFTRKNNYSNTSTQVVLIISDSNDISRQWESLLKQKGYTTVQETYENAVQTCWIVDPALIVIDTHLPHADRLVLCSRLRSVSSRPIILLVPDYKSKDMTDIYSAGVNECLLKPVSPEFLVVKVISWLLPKRWLEYSSQLSQVHVTP